jgi:SAM-dependent methyltransferase
VPEADAPAARSELDPRLLEHRRVWEEKATLRIIYRDYHRRLLAQCPPGPLLDIGGGSVHLKEVRADVISTDILAFPGIDVVCDAHRLPFGSGHFSGIVMLDVLHHLERPVDFLGEAARVLKPGGVLAMIEPGMSTVAYPFYRHIHQEPADLGVDPFFVPEHSHLRDPFDANQAIPTLLFTRDTFKSKLQRCVPELSLRRIEWLSLFAYPLSGGFKRWCLVPPALAPGLIRLEDRMPAAVRRFFGFRLLVVLEHQSGAGSHRIGATGTDHVL